MTQVLTFIHRSVRAAIPAQQADGLAASDAGLERIALWRGGSEVIERWLRLRAARGHFGLSCSEVELLEVPSRELIPISGVLAAALKLPHVVGFATIAHKPTWLVDVTRLTANNARVE
ncbi:MAG: hypothetical protein QM778_06850 [Myxococcales bacterium]